MAINYGNISVPVAPINATTSTLAVDPALHAGKLVTLNRAAGITATLPRASGSGAFYRFYVGTTITSNTTIIRVSNATDVLVGGAIVMQDGGSTVIAFEASGTDDTITFNGSTTGGIRGDHIVIEDVAAGFYRVELFVSGTGTEVTPFSATVS